MAAKLIDDPLFLLTGLSSSDLADTLASNPRAYMALKGAVAERHLWMHLQNLSKQGAILEARQGNGDFEKDFYVKLPNLKREIVIECKNVEVIKTTSLPTLRSYFEYLVSSGHIIESDLVRCVSKNLNRLAEVSNSDLKSLLTCIPQKLRESGLPRYQFSAHSAGINQMTIGAGVEMYLNRFSSAPLTIDFQRTRNARDGTKGGGKMNRFYKKGEVDVVAACLFSRTLKWEFIFCAANNLPKHPKFSDRYSNRLVINPKLWKSDLTKLF